MASGGWNKDVLGGKKSKNLTIRGRRGEDDYSGLESKFNTRYYIKYSSKYTNS